MPASVAPASMATPNGLVIIVPVYQAMLPGIERFSLDCSLAALQGRDVRFAAPDGLDVAFYAAHYPGIPVEWFDARSFSSIQEYNRLLLSPEFYKRFEASEFMLILQTDAILFRDDLDHWMALPFDYVGAPWPDGVEIFVNLGRFEGDFGKRVRVHVGNGGLSLRRIGKCIDLLGEFDVARSVFLAPGSSEDLFFAFMGALSGDFLIPNEITASRFSLELKPEYYFHVNGGRSPMGAHAWWKYNPGFFMPLLPRPLTQGDFS